jgi:hypothetical protein
MQQTFNTYTPVEIETFIPIRYPTTRSVVSYKKTWARKMGLARKASKRGSSLLKAPSILVGFVLPE